MVHGTGRALERSIPRRVLTLAAALLLLQGAAGAIRASARSASPNGLSSAAPEALRCPGHAIPEEGTGQLADEQWSTFNLDVVLSAPIGVALDAQCNVYVADGGDSRVVKLDPSGRYMAAWGGPGIAPGQFGRMDGVAVDAEGNLYVADSGNHRLQKLSPSGEVKLVWSEACPDTRISCVALPGVSLDRFQATADGIGNVYVATGWDMLKLSSSGPLLARWQSNATPGQLVQPRGIALDGDGNIFVLDALNGLVQEFSPTGSLLRTWPMQPPATPTGPADRPLGLAVDRAGNLYVANASVAVDGQGNRFLADPAHGRVLAALAVVVPIDDQYDDRGE